MSIDDIETAVTSELNSMELKCSRRRLFTYLPVHCGIIMRQTLKINIKCKYNLCFIWIACDQSWNFLNALYILYDPQKKKIYSKDKTIVSQCSLLEAYEPKFSVWLLAKCLFFYWLKSFLLTTIQSTKKK